MGMTIATIAGDSGARTLAWRVETLLDAPSFDIGIVGICESEMDLSVPSPVLARGWICPSPARHC